MTDLSAKPFSTNLEKYTFSQNVHIYQQSGCIGYLRADLGTSGKEFHSTWNEICSAFKTEEFSREFDDVIKNNINFIPVETIEQVFDVAFVQIASCNDMEYNKMISCPDNKISKTKTVRQ